MDKTFTERSLSLDFFKGFSILMVIFFHNIRLNPDSFADNALMMLADTAVPCFFLVSGILFFERPFALKKHIRRIAHFYFALAGWSLAYYILFRCLGAPAAPSRGSLLSYLFLFQTLDGVSTSHFWFMEAMLTVLLAAPFLRICKEDHPELMPYLLLILLVFNQLLADGNLLIRLIAKLTGLTAWDISGFGEINPFSFRYSNYMFYYILGGYLWEKQSLIRHPGRIGVLMAAAGDLLLILIKYFQSGTFVWAGTHLSGGYYWCSTILAAAGLFLIAQALPYEKSAALQCFSRTVGRATAGIFYLHIPLIFLLAPLFDRLAAHNGWLLNLAESGLIALIAFAITWIAQKVPVLRELFR